MRRRLREQTRMREALLVDLGALVYELHRHGRREPELLQAKASELTVVDQEVRALADALGAGEGVLALVSAGIAGSCERCGTLLSTDARYCSGCGAEAAPSLPGSGPVAPAAGAGAPGVGIAGGADPDAAQDTPDTALEPEPTGVDPEQTGVIGPAEPEWNDSLEEEPEPQSAPAPSPSGKPAEESLEPEAAEPSDPSAHAPWLAEEGANADTSPKPAGEAPSDEPARSPDSARRRRSGGAVGKVAGLIRRPRDGG